MYDFCVWLCMIMYDYYVPIGSMYGIYANIWGILMVHVTIYSIHGTYGVWLCLRTENRARKTHVLGVGWGGVGWGGGGHVNVPCTSCIIMCYAAKICGIVATLLVSLLRYFSLQRWRWKAIKRASIFPGFQIIKSARHCGKITIFGHNVHADEHGFRSGGMIMYVCRYVGM